MVIPSIKHMPSGQRRVLKNGQSFLIYIERANDNRKYHLVDWEGNDYGYFKPEKSRHPAVFAFYNPDYTQGETFTSTTWGGANIRELHNGQFLNTYQRKGQKYYWAKSGDNKVQGVKTLAYSEADKGYRLRADISDKGDAWISEEEVTGSIRFMDSENDRAIMYFVTFSDNENDPREPNGNYRVMTKAELSR
ncbi:hypothetical protein RMATCC62417_13367 [Rhizopus microsporus]|nr:hypothetical protein RMATCC62417_13367 [Rhizopus microsporus]